MSDLFDFISSHVQPDHEGPPYIYQNAIEKGNVEYLRFLLEKDCTPDFGEYSGNGWFLIEAAKCVNYEHGEYINSQHEILKMLSSFYKINEFSAPRQEDFHTQLTKACENCDLSLVKFIVEELGADVNAQCGKFYQDNTTALMYAISWDSINSNISVVRYLVKEYGAKVDAKDTNGLIPLHWASKCGNISAAKYLVEECAANVDAKDNGIALDLAKGNAKTKVDYCVFYGSEDKRIEVERYLEERMKK